MHCLFVDCTLHELPTFVPNEYFWKTHWKEGEEEKWQCYARVIREIIADVGDFKLYDANMEDKLEYKTHF